MSPISAFLFTLTEISILMLVIRRESQLVRNIAASLTAVTATVASVVIIGYGYGTPLFYGENSLLPVALLAAIAFLLLNIGVLTIASPDNWVVQQFAGNSVRAILLRTFLPLTLAILIAHGWLGFYFVSHYRTNPALATAVFAIITLFLVGTIIAFVASGIGGQIDQVEQEKKAFYRETILNATEGKLRISDEDDVMPYVDNAQVSTELNSAPEVGNVREKVKQFLEEHGLVGERLNDLMIAVSEAMANVVKHAGHGRIYVGADALSAWVVICDNGPGMESLTLPKAVLLKGFSTKNSLGLGYSIMLQMADRIILKTDKNGTEVVLVKDIAQEAVITLDNIPDTWGGIG
jgi:anti-sigma regulatory factor (Ser/Thr protein kinase)/succinate dehydrogenase hydrophobic anchor subunit